MQYHSEESKVTISNFESVFGVKILDTKSKMLFSLQMEPWDRYYTIISNICSQTGSPSLIDEYKGRMMQ